MVEVDASRVICAAERRVIGINVDYLVDHDSNRLPGARPLKGALKEMGVRSLRFPGGDKSDNHLWSVPPFKRPKPTLACGRTEGREMQTMTAEGEWKVRPMDFDDFMKLCRALKAEPTVVVCYDALHRPGCQVTRERLIETAAAWVAYANVKKGYGVRYWEIGNEGYIDTTVKVWDYARDLVDFAKAMKAVDPTIKIGANGPPGVDGRGREPETAQVPWWKVVFETAAEHIDFAAVHVYSCWEWRSYQAYRRQSPGYPEADQQARGVIEAARRWGPAGLADGLRVCVTELNAADWSKDGWPFVNDLGHALVAFDIFGTLLVNGAVDMAQLWNTRWVTHAPDTPSLWDAVDDLNQLQPTGKALAIWSQFLNEQMVVVQEPELMRTFASYSPELGRLSVFLINKAERGTQVSVRLRGYRPARSARVWQWSGAGPDDRQPVWSGPVRAPVTRDEVEVSLPADSLTVVELQRPRAGRSARSRRDAHTPGVPPTQHEHIAPGRPRR
jgi:alpha-L-arabinofuranosidase